MKKTTKKLPPMYYGGKEFKNIDEINGYRRGYVDGNDNSKMITDALDSANDIKKTMKCGEGIKIKPLTVICYVFLALIVLCVLVTIFIHPVPTDLLEREQILYGIATTTVTFEKNPNPCDVVFESVCIWNNNGTLMGQTLSN